MEVINNVMVSVKISSYCKKKRWKIDYLTLLKQVKVEDREMEVKDVLENYTNLEKECESAKQPISVELHVSTPNIGC